MTRPAVQPTTDRVASAITDTLISPNEMDYNGEAANVVDGLFAIARAIRSLASAVDDLVSVTDRSSHE